MGKAVVIAIAATLLAACSGNQSLPAASASGTAPVTFTVVVPGAPAARGMRPHFMSPSTQSVVVVLGSDTLLTMNVAPSSRACRRAKNGARDCAAQIAAPAGKQTFRVTAFDGANGSGNLLAAGSVTASLSAGRPQRVGISLTGTPAELTIAIASAYPPAGRASSSTVVVQALDADGNTIVGAFGSSSVTLTDGDASGATTLSGTSVNASGTKITLAYDGAPLTAAKIVARAPGLASASATFAPSPTTVARYNAPQMITKAGPLPVGVSDVCIGPDGNVWATGASTGAIEKIDARGNFTTYPLRGTEPAGISVGADHNLWFAEMQAGKIGKSTTGGVITSYSLPAPSGKTAQPYWTTLGPDRRTWFTDQGVGTVGIGAITTGGKVTKYALPAGALPVEIVAGPDGHLWITDSGLNAIDVMSTSGKLLAVHRIPTAGASPWGIAVGPDKNIWFAEFNADKIGRMTLSGAVKEFAVPTAFAGPLNVAAGPDGNVWFTETGGGFWDFVGKVGYITTGGSTIRDFPSGGSISGHVHDLVFDAKGNLWYTKFAFTYSALSKLVY